MKTLLDQLGFSFEEAMAGALKQGAPDFEAGHREGEKCHFDVRIEIDDLHQFLRISDRGAALSGTVTIPSLGGTHPIERGRFNLFTVDAATGNRRMEYSFGFKDAAGNPYYLFGYKVIRDDPGFDVAEDMTRLYTTIYQGDSDAGEVWGRGILLFDLKNAPALAASMRAVNAKSPWQRLAAYLSFASFAWGSLRDEYMKDIRILYDAEYDELALSGVARDAEGRASPFFLASGVRGKGYPWGDGECFWDLLLVVGDGNGGFRRYAIVDRVLVGLDMDVSRGSFHYDGPIYEIDGGSTSLSAMRDHRGVTLRQASISLELDVRALEATSVPFSTDRRKLRHVLGRFGEAVQEVLPSNHPLGRFVTPYAVKVRSGQMQIAVPHGAVELDLTPAPESCFGQATRGTLRNLKEPTLLYSYVCSIRPEERSARSQLHTGALRDQRTHYAADQLEKAIGGVISRTSSMELIVSDQGSSLRHLRRMHANSLSEELLQRDGDPILEVACDHYPTAVVLRRIVTVIEPGGARALAVEEAVSSMRLEAKGPATGPAPKPTVVAAFHDKNTSNALDRVLEVTDFFGHLEAARAASGKAAEDYVIVIKVNFMFSYSRADPSSFVDPKLVAHFTAKLRGRGYSKIFVVEAQNTYGVYFLHRSVREVAAHLGFSEADGYKIVDLTEDASSTQYFGPALKNHPVPATWRDADYRISFAKNKTHAYAYYTLTLKNIYGVLPLADKFKEYHCERDIYETTMELLAAYPVHFGLVDAGLSADGPFGVFADTGPNPTFTVLGGENLVAVDWVAASKMGIDPEISRYMSLAVERFGKPAITLIGDAAVYRPWLNVEARLTWFTHEAVDGSYYFGNLFYMACANMDPAFPLREMPASIRALRKLTSPLRRAVFVQVGEDPTPLNRFLNRLFYKLGF